MLYVSLINVFSWCLIFLMTGKVKIQFYKELNSSAYCVRLPAMILFPLVINTLTADSKRIQFGNIMTFHLPGNYE